MNTESGMISSLDNLEALLEVKLERADNCINPWCGKQISSTRQNEHPGADTCEECAAMDRHEEER